VELYILIIRARGLTDDYPLSTPIFNVERISRLSVLGGILATTPKHANLQYGAYIPTFGARGYTDDYP